MNCKSHISKTQGSWVKKKKRFCNDKYNAMELMEGHKRIIQYNQLWV
jgi:hypothetical protein